MAVKTPLFQAYRFKEFTPAEVKKIAKKAIKMRKHDERVGRTKSYIKNRLQINQLDASMNKKLWGNVEGK